MAAQTKPQLVFRKAIFAQTHAKIEQHNAKVDANFQMAHNIFSVMVRIIYKHSYYFEHILHVLH